MTRQHMRGLCVNGLLGVHVTAAIFGPTGSSHLEGKPLQCQVLMKINNVKRLSFLHVPVPFNTFNGMIIPFK